MSDALLEAEGLIADLPGAISRRSLGERLSDAITKLRSVDQQIERMTSLIRLARLIDYGTTEQQKEALADVTELAVDIGEALATADTAEKLRAATHDYDTSLRDAIRRLELQLGEHWRSIARVQFQPLLSLGELLSRMNVENDLGDRMVAFGRKALNPGTQHSAAQLLDSVATLRSEYEVLQADRAAAIGSDDVGEFINALAESRATLKMVTPTVQAWLSEHDALDALEISPR